MTRKAIRLVGEVSLFHGNCLTHRGYGMNCESHESLRHKHQDRCRLCGTADRYMGIDHDHSVGWTAVRGLLCAGCNAGHMRGIDHGEYAIDEVTRQYLISPWYLARKGQRLPYEPQVHVSINELSDCDRAELRRLLREFSPYGMRKAEPTFEHPGIAACLAYNDVRPLMRFRILHFRGLLDHNIAEPDLYLSNFQRNHLPADRWAAIAADNAA